MSSPKHRLCEIYSRIRANFARIYITRRRTAVARQIVSRFLWPFSVYGFPRAIAYVVRSFQKVQQPRQELEWRQVCFPDHAE